MACLLLRCSIGTLKQGKIEVRTLEKLSAACSDGSPGCCLHGGLTPTLRSRHSSQAPSFLTRAVLRFFSSLKAPLRPRRRGGLGRDCSSSPMPSMPRDIECVGLWCDCAGEETDGWDGEGSWRKPLFPDGTCCRVSGVRVGCRSCSCRNLLYKSCVSGVGLGRRRNWPAALFEV